MVSFVRKNVPQLPRPHDETSTSIDELLAMVVFTTREFRDYMANPQRIRTQTSGSVGSVLANQFADIAKLFGGTTSTEELLEYLRKHGADIYPMPVVPVVRIDTGRVSAEEAARRIIDALGLVSAPPRAPETGTR